MVALSIDEISWNSERASNIKPFVNKCNWKRIIYSSKIDDWKTFEKNDSTTAVNIWYIKEEKLKKKRKIFQLVFQKLFGILMNKWLS